MKTLLKLLTVVLVGFNVHSALAQSVTNDLVGLGMKAEVAEYIAAILPGGSVLGNNTYLKARNAANSADISVLKVDGSDETVLASDSGDYIYFLLQGDSNRLLNFAGASDTSLSLTWGDGGSTAAQGFNILASTSDADDDSTLTMAGGGAIGSSRGASLQLKGNEASGAGDASLVAGDASGSIVTINAPASNGTINFTDNSALRWQIEADGDLVSQATNGGDVVMSKAGATLQLQEGTAGAACMGTLTANGATPVVVSTTCAKTASRIFTSRTSSETGTVNAWVSAISNGVSFSVTSEAADTGTYNWLIINEAP